MNTEGRPQFAVRAVFLRRCPRIGELCALSDVVGSALEFDTSEELHQRLSKAYKTFETRSCAKLCFRLWPRRRG